MCVYGRSPPHTSIAQPETLLDSPPDMSVKRLMRRLRPWKDGLARKIFLRMAVGAPAVQPSATAPPSLRCVEQPLLLAAATLPVLAASASRLCTFVLCMRLAYCMSRDAHVHCLACARRRSALSSARRHGARGRSAAALACVGPSARVVCRYRRRMLVGSRTSGWRLLDASRSRHSRGRVSRGHMFGFNADAAGFARGSVCLFLSTYVDLRSETQNRRARDARRYCARH